MNIPLRVSPHLGGIKTQAHQAPANRGGNTLHFAAHSKSELEEQVEKFEQHYAPLKAQLREKALKKYRSNKPLYEVGLDPCESLKLEGPDILQLFKMALDKKSWLARVRKGPVFVHQLLPPHMPYSRLHEAVDTLANAGFLSQDEDHPNEYYLTLEGETELKNIARNDAKEPARFHWRDLFLTSASVKSTQWRDLFLIPSSGKSDKPK